MSIRASVKRFHQRVLNYNLFVRDENDYRENENDQPMDTTQSSTKEIYATWIYVFLLTSKYKGFHCQQTRCFSFIAFVYTLFFITLINPQKRTVTVSNPTLSLCNQLQRQYGDTLSCPCSAVSSPYKTFVSNTISLHPLCSSGFVSDEWVKALYFPFASLFPQTDIRTTAFSHVRSSRILY